MKRSKTAAYFLPIAGAALLIGCLPGGTDNTSGTGSLGTATIGGTVSGLPTGVTVVLVDNGSDTINVSTNGNFSFDTKVQAGAAYNVTMFTQPTGALCSVTNASGTVDQNADAVTNVAVSCQAAAEASSSFNVGVTVSGLAPGNSATMLNNYTDTLTAHANGLAVFSQAYAPEQLLPGLPSGSYNVTVGTSPSGQTCTLTNATGVNAGTTFTNFVNVTATCK